MGDPVEMFFRFASKEEKEEAKKIIKKLRETLVQNFEVQNFEENHFFETPEETDPTCWK